MQGTFASCSSLVEIPILDASQVVIIEDVFSGANALINFGGFLNLGKAYSIEKSANYRDYQLKCSDCTNLTHDSLMNVINNLYNIASIGVKPQQLALGSTNLAKLAAEEIAIATNKGWTVT